MHNTGKDTKALALESPDVENSVPGGNSDGNVSEASGLAGETNGGMSFLVGAAKVVAEVFQAYLFECTDWRQLFLPADNSNPAGSTVAYTALEGNRSLNTSRIDR